MQRLTPKDAIRIITNRQPGNEDGMLSELAKTLSLTPSTVRSWAFGSNKSKVMRWLLAIMVAARELGYLDQIMARAQEIEIIINKDDKNQ